MEQIKACFSRQMANSLPLKEILYNGFHCALVSLCVQLEKRYLSHSNIARLKLAYFLRPLERSQHGGLGITIFPRTVVE